MIVKMRIGFTIGIVIYFKNKFHPTLVIVPLLNNLKISYGKNYNNGKVMDKRHI
jgi:hypothetical protein